MSATLVYAETIDADWLLSQPDPFAWLRIMAARAIVETQSFYGTLTAETLEPARVTFDDGTVITIPAASDGVERLCRIVFVPD